MTQIYIQKDTGIQVPLKNVCSVNKCSRIKDWNLNLKIRFFILKLQNLKLANIRVRI